MNATFWRQPQFFLVLLLISILTTLSTPIEPVHAQPSISPGNLTTTHEVRERERIYFDNLYYGGVGGSDVESWYFWLDGSKAITLRAQNISGGVLPRLILYDSNNTEVARSEVGNNPAIIEYTAQPGWYTVQVQSADRSYGEYRLDIRLGSWGLNPCVIVPREQLFWGEVHHGQVGGDRCESWTWLHTQTRIFTLKFEYLDPIMDLDIQISNGTWVSRFASTEWSDSNTFVYTSRLPAGSYRVDVIGSPELLTNYSILIEQGGASLPEDPDLRSPYITDIVVSKDRAELGTPYFVDVYVHNPSTTETWPVLVFLEETGSTPSDGMDKNYTTPWNAGTRTTLLPGQTYPIRFQVRHRYRWFSGNPCFTTKDMALELLAEVLSEAYSQLGGDIAELTTFLMDVAESLDTYGKAERQRLYSYEGRLQVGSTLSASSRYDFIEVYVPGWKKRMFLDSLIIDSWWPKATIAGVILRNPRLLYLQAGGIIRSCKAKTRSLDPDSNFQEIATITHSAVPPEVTDMTEGPEKDAILALGRYTDAMEAAGTSFGRYEGAKEVGDWYWASMQADAADELLTLAQYELQALSIALRDMPGYQPTEADITTVVEQIRANGLPEEEVAFLKFNGFSDEQIGAAEELFLESAPHVLEQPMSDDALLTLLVANNNSLREYARESVESIGVIVRDAEAPRSEIHVSGQKGLSEWFVSSVLVDIAAEDFGGSGLSSIEWSILGKPWNVYEDPLQIDKEGVTTLQARSRDKENNVEFPPSQTVIRIDTRAPILTASLGSAMITRTDHITVTCNAHDPMPGSGVLETKCLFDDTPVEDQQDIDPGLLSLGTHKLWIESQDLAGLTSSNSIAIELIATPDSIYSTIATYCNTRNIHHHGICHSLQMKAQAALEAQRRGKTAVSIHILRALSYQIKAQRGRRIPTEVADLLLKDLAFVIQQLRQSKSTYGLPNRYGLH